MMASILIVPESKDTSTDMISDVVHATKAILLDYRGPAIRGQLQLLHITPSEAVEALREAADELEAQQ